MAISRGRYYMPPVALFHGGSILPSTSASTRVEDCEDANDLRRGLDGASQSLSQELDMTIHGLQGKHPPGPRSTDPFRLSILLCMRCITGLRVDMLERIRVILSHPQLQHLYFTCRNIGSKSYGEVSTSHGRTSPHEFSR